MIIGANKEKQNICSMETVITVIVENQGEAPLLAEHGLSLMVEYCRKTIPGRLLFDTGNGAAFAPNCKHLGIAGEKINHIALSHGHRDHTGAVDACMPGANLYCVPGIDRERYSRHPERPVRPLTMPENCQMVLKNMTVHWIRNCTEVLPGMYLTGPIPRVSGEDTGGPFFSDPEGRVADEIEDEQALLLDCGILIQGCSHAGIINTLTYCRQCCPDIPIHTVIGGLHLLHAGPQRLQQTADALKQWNIKNLYLMHCTGEDAVSFLKQALPDCRIETPHTGDRLCFTF